MSLSMVMTSPYASVLYVGPGYKNHRGGIGAVLDIYSKTIEPFQFVSTMAYRNKFYEMFFFTGAIFKVFFLLLTNRRIRIVHIHGAKDGSIIRKSLICFIAKKIFGRKIIFHSHAGAFNDFYERRGSWYKALCRFLVNNADAVIVLSDRWNDFFKNTFRIRKIAVIRNPVEHKPAATVRQLNSNGMINLLFLGRIADHKGIFDLVDVIVEAQNELRGKCKLLVGGNHEVERLKKAIFDGGVSDIVEYIGWIQGDDKERNYALCDYFVLPTYHEAMPMTVLEALSYSKPVITTPVGSIPEIVTDRQNGYLFEPGDKAQLKKILLHVVQDHSAYRQMELNASRAATSFYPETIKSELEKLYSEIL